MSKMFKVISAVEKDGKTKFWMRLGTAFVNRDNSINVYLDACPRSMQLQLREFDEKDRRGEKDGDAASPRVSEELPLPMTTPHTNAALADVPF